jgi:hypothetical protein
MGSRLSILLFATSLFLFWLLLIDYRAILDLREAPKYILFSALIATIVLIQGLPILLLFLIGGLIVRTSRTPAASYIVNTFTSMAHILYFIDIILLIFNYFISGNQT